MNRALGVFALALTAAAAQAQGNSPYSRYGLGDLAPSSHIINRGMGGVSAGDADFTHINFSNPASYSQFLGVAQARNKNRLAFGRVLFDVGVSIDERTLREKGRTDKFSSSEINLSYIQVGIPLRPRWGLAFGIRPVSRVSYMVQTNEKLPSGDSIYTEFSGNGGAYLPTIGTGFSIGALSLGANVGYLFGNRESNSARYFNNDSVNYYQAIYRTNSSYGKVFINFGAQYEFRLGKAADSARVRKGQRAQGKFLRLGASGNLRQSLNGTQTTTIGTFTFDPGGTLTDTIKANKDVKGTVVYPSSFTAGFMAGGSTTAGGYWTAGADVVFTQWNEYRFFGATDAVTNNMLVRVGGQFVPEFGSTNFFGRTYYRAGFNVGRDYVTASGKLPYWSATAGLGIQLRHRNRQYDDEQSMLNFGFEYINRGNNNNVLKENTFRLSIGLTVGDNWFKKRKYD